MSRGGTVRGVVQPGRAPHLCLFLLGEEVAVPRLAVFRLLAFWVGM